MRWTHDLKRWLRLPVAQFSVSNLPRGQAVLLHTCLSDCHQAAKFVATGKVTVGLVVSHWPCVADLSTYTRSQPKKACYRPRGPQTANSFRPIRFFLQLAHWINGAPEKVGFSSASFKLAIRPWLRLMSPINKFYGESENSQDPLSNQKSWLQLRRVIFPAGTGFHRCDTIRYDTIRYAILTCPQKPT